MKIRVNRASTSQNWIVTTTDFRLVYECWECAVNAADQLTWSGAIPVNSLLNVQRRLEF